LAQACEPPKGTELRGDSAAPSSARSGSGDASEGTADVIATEIGKAKRELVELYKLGQAEMETEIKYASFTRVPTCDHCALKSSTICARHGGTIHSTLSCVADAPCRCSMFDRVGAFCRPQPLLNGFRCSTAETTVSSQLGTLSMQRFRSFHNGLWAHELAGNRNRPETR
jgi:hypothetical protein